MADEKYVITNKGSKSVGIREEGYIRDSGHKYIVFRENASRSAVTLATDILTGFYLSSIQQSK